MPTYSMSSSSSSSSSSSNSPSPPPPDVSPVSLAMGATNAPVAGSSGTRTTRTSSSTALVTKSASTSACRAIFRGDFSGYPDASVVTAPLLTLYARIASLPLSATYSTRRSGSNASPSGCENRALRGSVAWSAEPLDPSAPATMSSGRVAPDSGTRSSTLARELMYNVSVAASIARPCGCFRDPCVASVACATLACTPLPATVVTAPSAAAILRTCRPR
mmetsp:Transcript_42556/g.131407  ORF Transcript_42556/g.131407 Transcript_42556/m.131407 type:complete len:219 (+) Transcript_42556:1064-1720(+)